MISLSKIEQVMHSSFGTTKLYKRSYGSYMDYTDGIMNVQEELNMYWFVDLMYSHMPTVVKDYHETDEGFYVVELVTDNNHRTLFKVTRELYNEDTEDYDEIIVTQQDLEYTDLPKCTMKFFLELACLEPLTFRLLCPSEH